MMLFLCVQKPKPRDFYGASLHLTLSCGRERGAPIVIWECPNFTRGNTKFSYLRKKSKGTKNYKPLGTNGPPDIKNDSDKTQDIGIPFDPF